MIVNYSSFEKSNFSNNSCFLFYGENQGRIEECSDLVIKSLKKEFGNISLIYFSNDDLKKGDFKKLLLDSLNEDIFGSKNILIISLQDQKPAKEIVDTLKKNDSLPLILILKCTQLKKSSALRNFFENSKEYLVVPCYEENETEKKNIIRKIFTSEGLNISSEEINLISNMLGNQKLEIENELNKLIIYLKTSKKDINSSLSVISENINENINKLIFFLSSKEKTNFLRSLFKSKEIQNDHLRLINYFSDHLMRILEVKSKIKSGKEKDLAIKSLKPPVFFKDIPEFGKHLDIWNEEDIYYFLKKLFLCQVSNLNGIKSFKFQLYFLFLKIINQKKNN